MQSRLARTGNCVPRERKIWNTVQKSTEYRRWNTERSAIFTQSARISFCMKHAFLAKKDTQHGRKVEFRPVRSLVQLFQNPKFSPNDKPFGSKVFGKFCTMRLFPQNCLQYASSREVSKRIEMPSKNIGGELLLRKMNVFDYLKICEISQPYF